MYVRKLVVENLKSIRRAEWEVAPGREPGWHVILGDNGSGKSTLLRALSLGLFHPNALYGLREDWRRWATHPEEFADVAVTLGSNGVGSDVESRSSEPRRLRISARDGTLEAQGLVGHASGIGIPESDYANRNFGLSVAYGPFRRFSANPRYIPDSLGSSPYLEAHLSLWEADFPLMEALTWLDDLERRKASDSTKRALLEQVILFLNDSRLLPESVSVDRVDPDGVWFVDGNGAKVHAVDLSDGYRAILSMVLDMLRRMIRHRGEERSIFTRHHPGQVLAPAVVLIDEVDAHLHPSWQHRIGDCLLRAFPNVQFIVSTHSPIICQAALPGSVFYLPSPGTEDVPRMLQGTDLDRLCFGSVLEAYGTCVFGVGVTRSEEGQRRVEELAGLNVASLDRPLSPDEAKRRDELAGSLSLTSGIASNGVRH